MQKYELILKCPVTLLGALLYCESLWFSVILVLVNTKKKNFHHIALKRDLVAKRLCHLETYVNIEKYVFRNISDMFFYGFLRVIDLVSCYTSHSLSSSSSFLKFNFHFSLNHCPKSHISFFPEFQPSFYLEPQKNILNNFVIIFLNFQQNRFFI